MDDGVAQLARVIAADAGDEMDAVVFGTSDARAIAVAIDRFCAYFLTMRVRKPG